MVFIITTTIVTYLPMRIKIKNCLICYTNYYLSSAVFSEKHATFSHNDTICAINFSADILFNFSFSFKYSNIVKLSCIVMGTKPSTFDPSINQFNKYFKVSFPSVQKKSYKKYVRRNLANIYLFVE